MQNIILTDFLLLPVYVSLLYLFIRSRSAKYEGTGLRTFYITAFFLHIFGAVLYALVIQYYYGYGDSFGYFMGSNFITNISKEEVTLKYFFYTPEDLSNVYASTKAGEEVVGRVMNNSSNLMIMKISAALSFIAFNRFLIITLFFGLFSFAGLWRLFIAFNEILENKVQKLLAITVLYTPSICFWGSGLIKDSICLGCLCLCVSSLHKMFIKRKYSFKDVIVLVLCFYTLFTVKTYIAAALLIALLVFMVHYFLISRKTMIEKWIYAIVILLAGTLILIFTLQNFINSLIEDSKIAIDVFKNAYESADNAGDAGSSFTSTASDFTPSGIILKAPANIFSTLFRPFLWETRSLLMLFSGLESSVALLAFLYVLFKTRAKFFTYIFTNHFILFAFVIVIILCVFIGFTTFNFGTMVRYRIPVFPFFAFMLISIFVKHKERTRLPA